MANNEAKKLENVLDAWLPDTEEQRTYKDELTKALNSARGIRNLYSISWNTGKPFLAASTDMDVDIPESVRYGTKKTSGEQKVIYRLDKKRPVTGYA